MGTLAFHTSSTNGVTPRFGRSTLDRIGGLYAAARHEWHVRQTVRAIEALDSHMLRDLGLTAGSVENAVRHGR